MPVRTLLFVLWPSDHRRPNSFPTRRSSDLTIRISQAARHGIIDRSEIVFDVAMAPIGIDSQSEFLAAAGGTARSEEHTSELQSRVELVCRLLLEKRKKTMKVTLDTATWDV